MLDRVVVDRRPKRKLVFLLSGQVFSYKFSLVTILWLQLVLEPVSLSLIQVAVNKQVIPVLHPLRSESMALPNGLSCATFPREETLDEHARGKETEEQRHRTYRFAAAGRGCFWVLLRYAASEAIGDENLCY